MVGIDGVHVSPVDVPAGKLVHLGQQLVISVSQHLGSSDERLLIIKVFLSTLAVVMNVY